MVERMPYGWDERDYLLVSLLGGLPSYGLIAPDDTAISRKQVIECLKRMAEERGKRKYGEASKP